MVIGILGGSFDPIHKGHIHIAETVLKSIKDINHVLLVPALRNPFKNEAETPFEQRVEMCRLAVSNINNVYVSDAEKEIAERLNKKNLFTIDLLDNMPKENKYYFIVGADCVDRFYMWNSYKEILDRHGLIILNRPGYDFDMSNKKVAMVINHPNVKIVNDDSQICASSSEIREYIKENRHVGNVPECVGNYIEKNKLYCR